MSVCGEKRTQISCNIAWLVGCDGEIKKIGKPKKDEHGSPHKALRFPTSQKTETPGKIDFIVVGYKYSSQTNLSQCWWKL